MSSLQQFCWSWPFFRVIARVLMEVEVLMSQYVVCESNYCHCQPISQLWLLNACSICRVLIPKHKTNLVFILTSALCNPPNPPPPLRPNASFRNVKQVTITTHELCIYGHLTSDCFCFSPSLSCSCFSWLDYSSITAPGEKNTVHYCFITSQIVQRRASWGWGRRQMFPHCCLFSGGL